MTGDPLRAIPVAKGTGHPRRSHLYNYILTTEKHVDRCQIKESGVRARARVCVSEGVWVYRCHWRPHHLYCPSLTFPIAPS